MRALLDEQLSSEIAVELRARGLDVEAVREREAMKGLRDEQVLEVASGEGRAVVTNNVKDYRPIASRRLTEGRGYAGLILLPSARSRSRAAVQALARWGGTDHASQPRRPRRQRALGCATAVAAC